MSRIIAVDFDGCLCEDRWPDIGEPNYSVIKALQRRQQRGDKVILWTCRSGALLNQAVKWCEKLGLHLDAVNSNLPERVAEYGNDSRKVSADEYWDDKAIHVAYGGR